MIQIDRQEIEKSLVAGSSHCVTCVVCVSPGIRARSQAPVCQQVKYALHSQAHADHISTNSRPTLSHASFNQSHCIQSGWLRYMQQ